MVMNQIALKIKTASAGQLIVAMQIWAVTRLLLLIYIDLTSDKIVNC